MDPQDAQPILAIALTATSADGLKGERAGAIDGRAPVVCIAGRNCG